MRTRFVEATQGIEGGLNWGKFLVGQFEPEEWLRPPSLPAAAGISSLLRARGWRPEHTLVLDLETGEGAIFLPGGSPSADLDKHRVWVCPMFEPFLAWLYEWIKQTEAAATHFVVDKPDWFELLPGIVELPHAQGALSGYRRSGPGPD